MVKVDKELAADYSCTMWGLNFHDWSLRSSFSAASHPLTAMLCIIISSTLSYTSSSYLTLLADWMNSPINMYCIYFSLAYRACNYSKQFCLAFTSNCLIFSALWSDHSATQTGEMKLNMLHANHSLTFPVIRVSYISCAWQRSEHSLLRDPGQLVSLVMLTHFLVSVIGWCETINAPFGILVLNSVWHSV